MKTYRLSLISTIFVAAFGLALGLMSAPAQAHCRAKHLDNEGNCIPHDVGQKSETFTVELIDGVLVTDPEGCVGRSKRKQVRDATFPPVTVSDCVGLTLVATDQDLHLCQVSLNRPDRPDMNVIMFFTTGEGVEGGVLCPFADPDAVYQGTFDARFEDPEACEEGNTCVVIIDQSELDLEKSHQPGKGTSAGESFSVGKIVWDPVE